MVINNTACPTGRIRGERTALEKIEDYRWEHAKIVADRCAKRFGTRTEIERYLTAIGWEQPIIERMIKYLDRKRENT